MKISVFFSALLICSILIIPNVFAEPQIQFWVKDVAKWWWEGQISDEEFITGIKYLMEEKIIHVSASKQNRMLFLEDERANISANYLIYRDEVKPPRSIITNFVIVGDMGLTSSETLDLIDYVDPELVFFAGDLGYSGAQSWFDFSDKLDSDFYIAIGNHETDHNTIEEWLSHYGLEKEFYSVDYQNVHFLVLASDSDFSPNSEQIKFVRNDLRQASTNPEIDWIIAIIHKPLYSSMPHFPHVIEDMNSLRNSFQPIFDLYDVDMVVQGHVHSYERTKPLMFNNTITDDSINYYFNPKGQIYVTVGTGTHSLGYYTSVEEWSVWQNSKDFGILNIRITDDRLISAEFLTNDRLGFDFFQINSSDFFHGIDLSGLNLSGRDLSDTILVGANLEGANLSGVDLSGVDLSRIILVDAILDDTNLVDADLTRSNLSGVDLSGKDLSGTILTGADLTNTNLSGADLSGVDLSWANLEGANLEDAILVGSDLSRANLSGVDLSNNDLSGVNLYNANLTNTNLSGTDLSGKDLSGTILTGANLEDANLSGVDLSGLHYKDLHH